MSETHLRDSILESFFPGGFLAGSRSLSRSKARFMSRMRLRSRSHALLFCSSRLIPPPPVDRQRITLIRSASVGSPEANTGMDPKNRLRG
ncbi:hypothetical protein AVEN_269970-1 [Araneus ventricosus]|uniref:Uncharacterized protein n=1 Tax=Araneus ventricosus TaxID=182803 RepID=A0A4Y2STN7_ARAVE|nr:hypothetical protein AVEN_269970-1 [Araneus ventricosus]